MIDKIALTIQEHDNTKNVVHIYSKLVRDDKIELQILTRSSDKELINNVVDSLRTIGKSRNLDEFDLNDNCREWITTILENRIEDEMSEKYTKFLLNDFTSSMMTRMREDDKYAIVIHDNDYLLICHAKKGEKTITPIYQVVDRMLDKDNVERFVIFQKEKYDIINISYYEHSPSSFFTRWLGVPDKDAYYYNGGENRIFGNIDGYKVAFELTDEDVENKLLSGNGRIKIENNQIVFNSQISRLPISQIRSGKKYYTKISQFLQDYSARRYQLTYYQEKYNNIIQSIDPLFHAYYDCKDKVIKYEDNKEVVIVKKRNSNFQIIFSGGIPSLDSSIEIDTDYLDQLYANFENHIKTNIFHVGVDLFPYDSEAYSIGPLEIYNNIVHDGCVDKILNYIKMNTIADKLIVDSLNYSIFYILAYQNRNSPISYLFDKLGDKILENMVKPITLAQNEGEVIEYKSVSILEGSDKIIADRLSNDIDKKIKENSYKIYLIGVEDDTKQIAPIPSNRINSDRLGHIEQLIKEKINENYEDIKVWPIKIPVYENECIVVIIVCK